MQVVTLVFGFICISNFGKGLAVALREESSLLLENTLTAVLHTENPHATTSLLTRKKKKTSALPEKVQAQEQRMDLLETPPSDSGPQIA